MVDGSEDGNSLDSPFLMEDFHSSLGQVSGFAEKKDRNQSTPPSLSSNQLRGLSQVNTERDSISPQDASISGNLSAFYFVSEAVFNIRGEGEKSDHAQTENVKNVEQ